MTLQPTRFSIDILGDEFYEGYSANGTWNGWDCPYFSYEQAQKVVYAFNASHRFEGDRVEAQYDAEQDAFCFFFESAGESDDFPAVEIEGQKLYPLGRAVGFGSERISGLNNISRR